MHGTLRVVANVPVVETTYEGLEETSSDDEKFLERMNSRGKKMARAATAMTRAAKRGGATRFQCNASRTWTPSRGIW